jgi:predicted ATPase
MLHTLAISGYRSLRDVRLDLGPLNVVTGPNGSGKSSLYRALRLLADVAQGRVVRSLAREGGIGSALWAGGGRRRHDPVALKLGFASDDYGYAIDLGYPVAMAATTAFNFDPVIKAEAAWMGESLKARNVFAERRGGGVRTRDAQGAWRQSLTTLSTVDSMMTHAADPREAVELLILRERMRSWRFYDQFRTDARAPARAPQVGTFTSALADDGADLASAIQTVREVGDARALDGAVEDAFSGARLSVDITDNWFGIEMVQPGLHRPLKASELSDGTLRYLLLIAALLTPRPPPLMVLNEPEASLHPDLIAPLARLIAGASQSMQVIVVSHASALVEALAQESRCRRFLLTKIEGETRVDPEDRPPWSWPDR